MIFLLNSFISTPGFAKSNFEMCVSFAENNLATLMRVPFGSGPIEGTHRFGDFADAVSSCKTALDESPENKNVRLQYARALIASTEFKSAAQILEPLVTSEYPVALRLYGVLTFYGEGVSGDFSSALKLEKRATELGEPVAPLLVGIWMRLSGYPESHYRPFFRLAVQRGYPPAKFYASSEIRLGELKGFSIGQALSLLQQAAASGWPPAMFVLARDLRSGKLLKINKARAQQLEDKVDSYNPGMDPSSISYREEFG